MQSNAVTGDMPQRGPLNVVWFKRDLRVTDHLPLARAAVYATLPLYIVEPDLWRQPDASARQWAFFRESLKELNAALINLGAPLIIRCGDAVDVLEALRQQVGTFALWSHQETGNGWTFTRDKRVRAWSNSRQVPWTEIPQYGVIRGLKNRNGWAARWDRQMASRVATPPTHLVPVVGLQSEQLPTEGQLGLDPDPCTGRQSGGRSHGSTLLQTFFDSRGVRYHKEMSSPNTAYEACSRLSAHFAAGTVSIREAAQATKAQISEIKALPPTDRGTRLAAFRAFQGRLHWHCHFIQKLEDEPSLEFENQHPAYTGLREDCFDEARFEAWASGRTGFPFIDACMRALMETGWINFRMRAMLAAFSSYHLWLHWRKPALHLARLFVDYEPGIHYPQMQMQSGVTGINTPRIYNPVKQSFDQDPDGVFIRRFVPELREISAPGIHQPWTLTVVEQQAAGCVIGVNYPAPIVDHMAAARLARERIWATRRGADYHTAADAIQEKHGSRKSGLPPSNPTKRKRRLGRNQLSLEL
jgi:deoxyribodipyrimidine photo-lyase